MAEDLVKRLREAHANSTQRIIGSDIFEAAADLIEQQAASLAAKDKGIAELRAVVSDCAKAIGNGAGVAPSSSIEFIELLPSEIAKYTDKLRRFLKCARDEGAEALDRAEQAERALAALAPVRDMLILCDELDGIQPGEQMAGYLRRLIDGVIDGQRALAEAVEVRDLLQWLTDQTHLELSFSGWDEADAWEVYSVTGGRNDREWRLIASETTPTEALRAARAFVAQHGSDSRERK